MLVEPIDDIVPMTVDTNEQYILDLESEIDSLKAQIKKLTKKKELKPSSYVSKEEYLRVCRLYQEEVSANLPF